MEKARENFVIGYAPKLTRANGLSTTGGKDLLQTWLKKIAAKWGKQGAINMANQAPDQFAYLLTQHWDCTIFMFVDGTLVMYGKNPKPKLPPQIVAVLIAQGVTQRTPVTWYKDPESDVAEQVSAGSVIVGLPAPQEDDLAVAPPQDSAFESMARIIVDELTGS